MLGTAEHKGQSVPASKSSQYKGSQMPQVDPFGGCRPKQKSQVGAGSIGNVWDGMGGDMSPPTDFCTDGVQGCSLAGASAG